MRACGKRMLKRRHWKRTVGESSSGSGSGATTSGTDTSAAASTPATEVGEKEVSGIQNKEREKENKQPTGDQKSDNGSNGGGIFDWLS